MGFLYALVAVGLTIIWGLMEMINFAHGEFLMLGMFAAWGLSAAFGLDPLIAIVPIGLVMFAFGMLVYQQLMRRVQGGDPFTQIFATIGLHAPHELLIDEHPEGEHHETDRHDGDQRSEEHT